MKEKLLKDIKNQIDNIRNLILSTKVTMLNYDYFDKLIDIERKLWDMLYFIKNQEDNWLIK